MADNEELRNNLVSFKEAFRDYTDCYTLIGGSACFILMDDAGLSFRATHDIDMILVFEDKRKEFGSVFWNYIIRGGYTCGWKEQDAHYYRFTNPDPGFPKQIELFSRREDFRLDARIIPVHIADDVSSLSAIALDDDFYSFMMKGRRVVDDISVLDAIYLIPFKMYAWLNNRDFRESGHLVNTDDIKKHKNDVFRLLALVNSDDRIEVSGNVKEAVDRFCNEVSNEPVDTSRMGIRRSKEKAIELLRTIYGIPDTYG